MFACNACTSQHKRPSGGEPRIAVLSGGPGVDLEPLLAGFKDHQAVSVINLNSRYLPGSEVPVAAHQKATGDRLRHAAGLAVTHARSGLTPVVVIALPHDPWFTATHIMLDHIAGLGVPAVHAHLYRPMKEALLAAGREADLVDMGIMYRHAGIGIGAGPAAATTAHALSVTAKELAAAVAKAKASPAAHAFLKAALLHPTSASASANASARSPLRTKYPSDLMVAASLNPRRAAAQILQRLAETDADAAAAEQRRLVAPSQPPSHAPCLSREWLRSALGGGLHHHRLAGTDLLEAPQVTDPPVHLLTYLSKNFADTGHGRFWVATAEKYGYDYTILGTDAPWPGLGTKIQRYYDFLVASPFADDDIVVVTDADDVVLNVTPAELLQRYEKVRGGKELVVSTEWDHIWPNRIVLPGAERERYPSINVGLFCGTKRALLDVYRWELRDGFNEDQIRFKDYIDANGTQGFAIDYHHELFSCMREDYQADLNVLDSGVLEVSPYHTIPAAVHFPGPMGKSLFAKIQTRMVELGSVKL